MKRYSTFDLIIISMMAALGLGTKQIIRPLISLITVPIGIPGGAIVGGFYMFWLVLTKRLSPNFGSGFLFGITQALVVMILPFGSHCIYTLITYSLPGLFVDIINLFFSKKANTIICSMIEGAIANFVGSFLVLLLVFKLDLLATTFIILIAFFTGNIGGIIAFYVSRQVNRVFQQELNANNNSKSKGKTSIET